MDISRELVRIAKMIERTAGPRGSGYHDQEGNMWFHPGWDIRLVLTRAYNDANSAFTQLKQLLFALNTEEMESYGDIGEDLVDIKVNLTPLQRELKALSNSDYTVDTKEIADQAAYLGSTFELYYNRLLAIDKTVGGDCKELKDIVHNLNSALDWLKKAEKYYK